MAILHKNITAAADIHNPKWFSGANNGDYAFKNEKGELESIDELLLPAALNFVDGSVAPPTTNSGDIYILSSGGSVNAGWGGVSLQDWVRYDGTAWNSITPQKSSLCYDKTADALKVYDGSAWAGMGSSFGKFGIADSTGAFTYYSGIDTALAAASSGDVIEQFANISVSGTSSINFVDGITWNMNGYEYKNTAASDFYVFRVPASTTFRITGGGKIKKTGGTGGATNAVMYSNQITATVYAHGITFESSVSLSASINCSQIGGVFLSTGGSAGFRSTNSPNLEGLYVNSSGTNDFINCKVYNSTVYSVSSYNYIRSSAKVFNCIFRSDGSRGGYLGNGSNEAHNCTFYSTAGDGVEALGGTSTVFSKLFNCSAYSTSSEGGYIRGYAESYSSDYYSTANSGLRVADKAKIFGGSSLSTANIAVYGIADPKFIDVKANCLWNNAGGHAFAIINAPAADGFLLSGCFGEVVNSSANGLNANSVADGKWAKNTFKGCTTAIVNTNANNMVNTADTYGNLLI